MDKAEVSELLKKIKRRYQTFQMPTDLPELRSMIDEWHEDLKDVQFSTAAENLRRHASTEDWPPSLAKLKRPLDTDADLYNGRMRDSAQEYIEKLESWRADAVKPPQHVKERMKQLAERNRHD